MRAEKGGRVTFEAALWLRARLPRGLGGTLLENVEGGVLDVGGRVGEAWPETSSALPSSDSDRRTCDDCSSDLPLCALCVLSDEQDVGKGCNLIPTE